VSERPRTKPRPAGERLQKVLAQAGFGSRRTCEELVAQGRVTVNGAQAVLGTRVEPELDVVAVDGVRVAGLPDLVHYLLNKPRGVVTTAEDPGGRPAVVDLVPRSPRVFPVGRLDRDTEGLIILTNDGELAQRLAHPSFGVEKEYLARVVGRPAAGALRRLRAGVELSDGVTAPARVGVVGDPSEGMIRITIHEGRNREVRRMCEAVGHPVRRLVRVRIGPVRLRDLQPGRWRRLSAKEVHSLAVSAVGGGQERPRRSGVPARGPKRAGGRNPQADHERPTRSGKRSHLDR
jgi:23S rRNA pseudouridine2605 synthase